MFKRSALYLANFRRDGDGLLKAPPQSIQQVPRSSSSSLRLRKAVSALYTQLFGKQRHKLETGMAPSEVAEGAPSATSWLKRLMAPFNQEQILTSNS